MGTMEEEEAEADLLADRVSTAGQIPSPTKTEHASNPITLTTTARRLSMRQIRLPPEVNRILYIRNLPYKITAEEMYDIFGKYGPIRQIRVGNTPETRGTAYVVYEDIFDAKNACDHLSGFNVCNRYLVVLYYNANRASTRNFAKTVQLLLEIRGAFFFFSIERAMAAFQKMDTKKKEEQLKLLKEKYGINTDPPK
ncbi:hypothetical protein JD844_023695 [Phrynosoma platyrhinos]|uniref:RRM domain-containing protein n=1 Tax=Phrynosoma platyrhinos TaxID=52577 RepID=A0ABQ7SWY6_PHRPL|nr:hypothetical protein JD844_023695 [Phrynosoma platyrhinos]